MFSEELECIIEAALADGVLTDKESEVLHKRAAAEGVDLNELDVVIEGRLAKMKREKDWLRPEQPKVSDKYGQVQKCPRCNEPVEPMAVKCSACGYEFRNVEALKSSRLFAERVEAIEKNYRDNANRFMRNDEDYEDKCLLNEERRISEMATAIKIFPIPATKEDLLDFSITMRSRWNVEEESELKNAYKAKYDECINKAKLLFPNDPMFQDLFLKSEADNKLLNKLKRSPLGMVGVSCAIIYIIIMIILLITGKL